MSSDDLNPTTPTPTPEGQAVPSTPMPSTPAPGFDPGPAPAAPPPVAPPAYGAAPAYAAPAAAGAKSRVTAGLLGILLGGFGVHSFYLGNTKKGIIQIAVTIVTCGFGALWGFIEGIMIFAGKINEDAEGRPLAD